MTPARAAAAVAAAAALVLAVLACSGSRLPPLTVPVLETNHRLWLGQGIASYEIDVVVTGTGLEEPETIHLEVREDSVTHAERGGRPMTGDITSYTVPGLFSTLARECELAAEPEAMGAPRGYQVYLQARFHPELGYPLHFRRIVGGSNRKVEMRITRFERR